MELRYAHTKRLLFICKRREGSGGPATHMSSGLLVSASLVVEMLVQEGVDAKLVEVNDNNDIDREVTAYRPTHVLIEAFWVVPAKFDVLARLHPTVSWIIRAHSELPFLAMEGIAVEWIIAYAGKPNVVLAANTPVARDDILTILRASYPAMPEATLRGRVLYLPNFYPEPRRDIEYPCLGDHYHINIACFGALRPLKNQLTQAVAAILFGAAERQDIHFHINATRIEGGADPVLRNLRALFARTPHFRLVEHPWLNHDDFLELMRTMDLSLQVSMSETFNIVTADAVASGVPVVTSEEVYWLDETFWADPNSTDSIVGKMLDAWRRTEGWVRHQARLLRAFSAASRAQWLGLLHR